VPLLVRRERLLRMQKMLDEHGPVLAAAVQADFGMRSPRLTEVADFFVLRTLAVAHPAPPGALDEAAEGAHAPGAAARHGLDCAPAAGRGGRDFSLELPGAAGAGPGHHRAGSGQPRHAQAQRTHAPHFGAAGSAGGAVFLPPTSSAWCRAMPTWQRLFASLPFDHLVFTGSTAVGRKVAQAAAQNLTPTTLELGGKSPCIIDGHCDMKDAALKIAHGKLLNAGQTCIAPDYVLLPRGREASLPRPTAAVARLFPTIEGNPDYASIITPRHHARLRTMLQQAQTQGAEVQTIDPASRQARGGTPWARWAMAASRQMLPTLVFGATSAMQLMQEEIFGPILPVISYERLDDAITHINAGPRPLALYWFGSSEAVRDDVLRRTVSGGVTVNDTLMHIAHDNLPFGGVGDSGWGAYHGEQGFLRFCHQKSVLVQSRWAMGSLFYPPYVRQDHGPAAPPFAATMPLLFRFLHSLFSFGFSMSSIQVRPATLRDAKAIAQIHTVSAKRPTKDWCQTSS
jgi:coniferyl-aldehyde dehydrogenase